MLTLLIAGLTVITVAVLIISLSHKSYYTYHEKVPKVVLIFGLLIVLILVIGFGVILWLN